MKHSNHLIDETSPYLLQHAHNPVEWYPWGEKALTKAKNENKPILVSIGYSACHWCHVMERESFEDEETAAVMNKNFINIKIDREERPDLDHIYMDAVQAMTGSGGWPLNVFLTPEAKPFYGGTYFPPSRAFNRPSWKEILHSVSLAFHEKRNEIDAQAETLTDHLLQSNSFGQQKNIEEENIHSKSADEIYVNLLATADREWGGFGKAPKFPHTFSIQYLLRREFLKGDGSAAQALLSLDKMIDGGIYDQLGGGFARYSTDTEWLAPHFEKMLYDNALLVSVLSEAYQLTKNERYMEVIEETMEFLRKEMLDPSSGFYSALDADSEGKEGKYYVWDIKEVEEILGDEAKVFCEYYDVTAGGNWEHTTILRVKNPDPRIKKSLPVRQAGLPVRQAGLADARKKLLEHREKRVRPGLDDKIILGWNALMNTACSKAYAATGKEEYRHLATANMNFILENLYDEKENKFYHTWKKNKATQPAFLDDLAFLVEALIYLQEITADQKWLEKAKSVTEIIMDYYSEENLFFFYTSTVQDDVIVRKKEVYDGAVPSGNSVMAFNLHRLGILFDRPEWKKRSANMLGSLSRAVIKYPGSFGNWACLLQELANTTFEIVINGINTADVNFKVLENYIPHRVLIASSGMSEKFPLLAGKEPVEQTLVYLCSNYSCSAPVFSAEALMLLINRAKSGHLI